MAARRSRANAEKPEVSKQDKSGNILSAPSMKSRLLREPAIREASRPEWHCDLSRQAAGAVHGEYLGKIAYSAAGSTRGAQTTVLFTPSYTLLQVGHAFAARPAERRIHVARENTVYEAIRSIPDWRPK
jgi:hypothetical protein